VWVSAVHIHVQCKRTMSLPPLVNVIRTKIIPGTNSKKEDGLPLTTMERSLPFCNHPPTHPPTHPRTHPRTSWRHWRRRINFVCTCPVMVECATITGAVVGVLGVLGVLLGTNSSSTNSSSSSGGGSPTKRKRASTNHMCCCVKKPGMHRRMPVVAITLVLKFWVPLLPRVEETTKMGATSILAKSPSMAAMRATRTTRTTTTTTTTMLGHLVGHLVGHMWRTSPVVWREGRPSKPC